ncbi:hypothetical protein OF122_07095 [Pelagibacterium flavum]|uniref:Uncharacterized protein n=1 Tax=Pelagibacterium flavum TaxID=2984530 RepID=A0ABY6ISX6_9HYPH|nr:DUF6653 family protein [Pelagibacterium sp. YIM 151497]UYQ73514.1 hypothetical protein OF122_07095 [Pelagibacterium sp. YIM 151497]
MNRFGLERLMAMSATDWARHANPWSGWSRTSILPLLAIAGWSRLWIGWWALLAVAAVLVWTWMNPRVFPPPSSIDNWMSQGVLGEHVWLQRPKHSQLLHHIPIIRALTIATATGTLVLFAGLVVLNLALTTTGLAIAMLSKLWLLDRMVWIYWENDRTSGCIHQEDSQAAHDLK